MIPSAIEKIAAAFCAMIFAAIVLFGLVVYGDPVIRALALWAAFLGVVSQYLFQGNGPARIFSIYAAAIGFLLTLIALLSLTFHLS